MMPKNSTAYAFVCEICGAAGESGYPQTKRCKGCRREAVLRRDRRRHAKNGHVSIGTEFACQQCGSIATKTQRRQHYCVPCSALSTGNMLPSSREWNRNYQREYQKRRRQESAAAAINARISANIKNSLRDGKGGRRWESLVDFTLSEVMAHLEAQFLPGMTWENRGKWHIDHIRPLCSFEFQTPDDPQFREAWALSNLQPLWAKDNLSKGGRWEPLAA